MIPHIAMSHGFRTFLGRPDRMICDPSNAYMTLPKGRMQWLGAFQCSLEPAPSFFHPRKPLCLLGIIVLTVDGKLFAPPFRFPCEIQGLKKQQKKSSKKSNTVVHPPLRLNKKKAPTTPHSLSSWIWNGCCACADMQEKIYCIPT